MNMNIQSLKLCIRASPKEEYDSLIRQLNYNKICSLNSTQWKQKIKYLEERKKVYLKCTKYIKVHFRTCVNMEAMREMSRIQVRG